MATVTKTFTENEYNSNKSTWTLKLTGTNITVSGNTFSTSGPSVTVSYSGTNKGYGAFGADFDLYVDGIYYESPSFYRNTAAWASGTTFTQNATSYTKTTSDYFNSSNKTTKTLNVTASTGSSWSDLYFHSSKDADGNVNYNSYQNSSTTSWGTIATITLNAPPQVTLGTPTYAAPHYAGLGAYSVTVTSASAQYGGNIQTITLAIGSNSVTQNYSTATVTNQTFTVVPSIAGNYIPTITVIDTRGQTTTVQLPQITVNAYNAPSINFDVQRCTNADGYIGVPDTEGEKALVIANISYTKAIANLTQPTVLVQDGNGNTIASSATWYETWTAQNGADDAVDWTNYNPSNPVTLYAVVSATNTTLTPSASYSISITPTDSQSGSAQTITQTLPTSFFTIDFQAGGKEIAFGAPANDNLSSNPDGLFKCNMESKFINDIEIRGETDAYDTIYTNSDSNIGFISKNADIDKDTATTNANVYNIALQTNDVNGSRIGRLETSWRTGTDGRIGFGFGASREVSGTWTHNMLTSYVANDGTPSWATPDSLFDSLMTSTRLMSLIDIPSHTIECPTINASSHIADQTETFTKSGYYPIALAGFNYNSRNAYITQIDLSARSNGSVTIKYTLKNTTSSAITGTKLYVRVLWLKMI